MKSLETDDSKVVLLDEGEVIDCEEYEEVVDLRCGIHNVPLRV